MRILFLNTDYPSFLASFYHQNPLLALRGYDAQLTARNASMFGTADFMSRPMITLGHAAIDIHGNNRPMQEAWIGAPAGLGHQAIAAGVSLLGSGRLQRHFVRLNVDSARFESILSTQIAAFAPTILYNHDPSYVSADMLKALLPKDCALVGQIASPRDPAVNWRAYDLMISSLPNFVASFRAEGVTAEYLPLCFEPSLREQVPVAVRDVPLSFVGSLSPVHRERLDFVEAVAARNDLSIWGDGVDLLPGDSALRKSHHGTAWGPAMFALLGRSQMTLNKHIDIAENYANNMRLYEATGMGACLATDAKENLAELFLPGKEVLAYESAEECIDLIRYYRAHDAEREAIAHAGRERCLRDHNYQRRITQLASILTRHFG